MPKIFTGLINFLYKKITRLPINLAKIIGKFGLKNMLVPAYKAFLFIEKNLVKNPLLINIEQRHLTKSKTIIHSLIIVITIFVLINNFATKNTHAENFNKNSIIAELFTDDLEKLIIETSSPLTAAINFPKTESVSNEIIAIKSVNTQTIESAQAPPDIIPPEVAFVQNGELAIKPTIMPNGEIATPANSIAPVHNDADKTEPTTKSVTTYIVQSGDTLSGIADRFNINVNTILWENNLSLSSYIRPGDELAILPINGVTYAIKSGDTLSSVANRFSTSVNKIIDYNDLDPSEVLQINQKLIIPDGKLGTAPLTPTKSIGSIVKAFQPSTENPSESNFIWPSTSKRITQYYHLSHHAIDIGAKLSTPIYASRSGRVERAGWNTGYGYNIVIDHGNGVKTLYGHASKLYLKHGDQVEQGEVIGEVGSTGWSTGPHVHFEIIINGSKVNPLSYL